MTDIEIINALGQCETQNTCSDCPYFEKIGCKKHLYQDAYHLIIRQKAEIERLRNTVKTDFLTVTEKLKFSQSEIGDIRTEAIKEFAERLKEKVEGQCSMDFEDVDSLADEMCGKDEGIQRELDEINRPKNEELFDFLENQYQKCKEALVNYESSKNEKQRKEDGNNA